MLRMCGVPTTLTCCPLLLLISSGCVGGEHVEDPSVASAISRCFVLPGARTGITRSYRVVEGGRLEEAGEVRGGAMHMRAAFHPDGRTLYINSVGPDGWEPPDWQGRWQPGVHVRAYSYDPADCSVGRFLGAGRMGSDAPLNERAYGLEVHPDGRFLYQTTNSLQRIRIFEIPADRVPVPRAEFDVTADGAHVCAQIRRLAMHPSAQYLYANCNNGHGVEDALQLWALDDSGTIRLLEHYTFPAMNAGVLDPVVHPSGDWLYQPVGTISPAAPAGAGAYVLVYRVAENGVLALHDPLAVRTITPDDSIANPAQTLILPMNVLLHPDGRTAYIPLNVGLDAENFPHAFAIYGVEDGGGRLVERARRPALRETKNSSHHGATLASVGERLFMYSYLTDYDTIQGGILQRLRVTDDYLLEPLDPAWVPTGLLDARQPISLTGDFGAAATPR